MLTYNREELISRAIESVLTQTFSEFEYLVIDNGSTDCSGLIAETYASKDERISVIHRERGNIGSGRNTGLDAASGEWVTFIDDDDWCEPDFLKFLYDLAIEYNADVSICGATDKAFEVKRMMTAEESIVEVLQRKLYNVQFPTKLIKRDLFTCMRFSEQSKYDDIELMPKILARANRVVYYGLPKYTFYRHETNNSAWTTNHHLLSFETLEEYLKVYRERTKWLCTRFPENSKIWRYFLWSFMISMVEKIDRLQLSDCYALCTQMRQELEKHSSEFLLSTLLQDLEIEWMGMYVV